MTTSTRPDRPELAEQITDALRVTGFDVAYIRLTPSSELNPTITLVHFWRCGDTALMYADEWLEALPQDSRQVIVDNVVAWFQTNASAPA